jgi:hypothetical protein
MFRSHYAEACRSQDHVEQVPHAWIVVHDEHGFGPPIEVIHAEFIRRRLASTGAATLTNLPRNALK